MTHRNDYFCDLCGHPLRTPFRREGGFFCDYQCADTFKESEQPKEETNEEIARKAV